MTVNFRYVGRNQQGQKINGVIKADDLDAAIAYLQKQAITPLDIKAARNSFDFKKLANVSFGKKVDTQELLSFCRGIAALDEAGIPLVDAFKQLSLACASKAFAAILQEIAENISAGKNLANSLRIYPSVFPALFTNIVEISENTGNLSSAFLQLASYIEMAQTNHRRLASTIRYPLTVICAAVIGCLVINAVVIPKLTAVFSSFKGQLPVPTKILMSFASFLSNHWPLLLGAAVLLVGATPFLLRITGVRLFWDKLKLHLPIFGGLQKRVIIFQFTWTFGLILHSGLPLLKGLTFAANGTGNSYFNKKVLLMSHNIEKGERLSKAAAATKLFPPSILQMLAVGEESGHLEDILKAITGYYEREIDYDIKRLNNALEPILLVLIGAMVLLMALGVYLPLWNMVNFAKMGA